MYQQPDLYDPQCRKFLMGGAGGPGPGPGSGVLGSCGLGPGDDPMMVQTSRNIQEVTTTTFGSSGVPGVLPVQGGFDRKVVINLPAYIVNSHAVTTDPGRDVSMQYNLQLKSPDNENLYVNEHHVLLQVMSQYVYYRKLCIWIKDELKKKRLELLESARRALIDARDGEEICGCDSKVIRSRAMPENLLTDVEKDFLNRVGDISCTTPMKEPAICNLGQGGAIQEEKIKGKRNKCGKARSRRRSGSFINGKNGKEPDQISGVSETSAMSDKIKNKKCTIL